MRVAHDSAAGAPVEGAVVRSGVRRVQTDARGEAVLVLSPGPHTVA